MLIGRTLPTLSFQHSRFSIAAGWYSGLQSVYSHMKICFQWASNSNVSCFWLLFNSPGIASKSWILWRIICGEASKWLWWYIFLQNRFNAITFPFVLLMAMQCCHGERQIRFHDNNPQHWLYQQKHNINLLNLYVCVCEHCLYVIIFFSLNVREIS